MKKIVLAVLLACTIWQAGAQTNNVTREGNTFRVTARATNKAGKEAEKTAYQWADNKGRNYPIYLSKNGRAYIIRTSGKTGKEYRYYLGEDISRTICAETGKEYVDSKNK